MDVAILYFNDCPNHLDAETQLTALLAELGWQGSLSKVNVETVAHAEQLGFRGSPTVLVNGADPFAEPDAPVGLACRVYRTDNGLQGTPPIDELRLILRVAMASE